MRDDFPEDVKRTLASRAAQICSNPDCQATTSGPQDDPSKFLNIGVAAHITAASPGGARYDDLLTPELRRSATNGIWLCHDCAKLVDNDESQFDVGLLKAWKYVREHNARLGIGQTAGSRSADTDSQRKCKKLSDWVGKRVALVKVATGHQGMVLGARPWASIHVILQDCNEDYVRVKADGWDTSRSIPMDSIRLGWEDRWNCPELQEYGL